MNRERVLANALLFRPSPDILTWGMPSFDSNRSIRLDWRESAASANPSRVNALFSSAEGHV